MNHLKICPAVEAPTSSFVETIKKRDDIVLSYLAGYFSWVISHLENNKMRVSWK
jgi:hypothetical protein